MTSTSAETATTDPHRLPSGVVPQRYDLTLAPDLARRDFVGDVAITVDVAAATSSMVCNTKDLTYASAWFVGADGARNDATCTVDADSERVTFTFERMVSAGSGKLHVRYTGVLNDKLRGFYASTYEAADGSTKVIATSQMQSTDARSAFPCWDEPAAKAVFGITLVHDAEHMALSNMHEVSSTALVSGKKATSFADTPRMSTYLVAVVVGELEATDPVDVDGIPLRIIARPGQSHLTKFGLEAGAFALRYFQDWYGIPYPGTKLDMIATPDFAFGAMENLGAVTFRETLLLADEATATTVDLEHVADVVAHEIAHMWFGDLVTMKWWNGIWLNEAFATFAEVSCTAKFRPEWDRWTSFSIARSAAAAVDGLHATRPIEFPVGSPSEAEGMFDVLTYEKGASVLRQLEQYLGEDRFRDGVRHYLTTHQFGNTETTDLFDAIEHVVGEPVRALMDSWIFQGGYPLIEASLDTSATPPLLHLAQRPFTYLAATTADERIWSVPVLFRSFGGDTANPAGTESRVLLTERSTVVTLPVGTTSILVNSGGHGFYRVGYDAAARAAVLPRFESLAAVERYQIVADTWATVVQGSVRAQTFLDLVSQLGNERDVNVWTAAVEGLSALYRVYSDVQCDELAARIRRVLGPIAAELGWDAASGESARISQLRGLVVRTLGTIGADPTVRGGAAERIDEVLSGGSVHPDVAPAVITTSALTGDAALWERYDARRPTTTPQERQRLLHALGSFPDPALIDRTLAMMLTDQVRSQDAPYALGQMLASRTAGPSTWAFVRDNWAAINERFPDNAIPRLVGFTSALSETEIAAELRSFFAADGPHSVPQGRKQIEQTLERLAVNEGLRARERAADRAD